MKILHHSVRRALLLGFLVFNASAFAAASTMEGMEMPKSSASAGAKPKNAAEALEALHKAYSEFIAAVTDSRQADVHLDSDKVIAAATTLGAFAKDLPSEKRGRLTGAVNNFLKGLNALHETAHQGVRANTDKAIKTTDDLMKVIDGVFAAAPAKK